MLVLIDDSSAVQVRIEPLDYPYRLFSYSGGELCRASDLLEKNLYHRKCSVHSLQTILYRFDFKELSFSWIGHYPRQESPVYYLTYIRVKMDS